MTLASWSKKTVSAFRQLVIGILGSLLAPLVSTYFGWLSVPWGVALSFAILSVVFAYNLFRCRGSSAAASRVSNDQLDSLGIQGMRAQDPIPADAVVSEAVKSFYFWGISGKRTATSAKVREAIVRIGRGGEVRFLIMNPDSPYLDESAGLEGDSAGAWRREILATIERIKDLAESRGVTIQIKLFNDKPIWRAVVVDDKMIYLQYFVRHRQGSQSSQIDIQITPDGLSYPILAAFEDCWKRAQNA